MPGREGKLTDAASPSSIKAQQVRSDAGLLVRCVSYDGRRLHPSRPAGLSFLVSTSVVQHSYHKAEKQSYYGLGAVTILCIFSCLKLHLAMLRSEVSPSCQDPDVLC